MLCPQCHAEVAADHKYCPSCGLKLEPTAIPLSENVKKDEDSTPPPPQFVKKKRMPIWFKIAAFLAVLALIGVTAGILFTETIVNVVDNQLKALREQNIPKAYSYTSKDFQEATSLDQFRNFVEAYPVLLDNQSAHFTQRSIENNIGTLRGNLTSRNRVNIPIEYKLIKDEGKWKILSIRFINPANIQLTKEGDHAKDLIEVAKIQLKEIQDKKILEAYQQYSSQEFKDATSEEAFQEYIKRHSIFNHYHVVSFHNPTIRNGVGTLSVILQSDQFAAYLKYYFIFENHAWKIWSMRIMSPSEEEERLNPFSYTPFLDKPMSLGLISLSDQVDKEGQIKNSANIFKSDLKDLYIDIEIKNGRKNNIISLNLLHKENGTSIPAKAIIEENGDSMLMSVFSPPASGWPKGHYTLNVSSPPNLNRNIEFVIE